ncbi:MAG: sulfatase-like hydrolase/transferase [Planctomycetota bacterium]
MRRTLSPVLGLAPAHRALLARALAAVLVLASCGEEQHPLERVRAGEAVVSGQGVLVIVVDGLRWDHTSLAGYDRATTPFLARFARDAMVFSNAWSASPSLVGSHVAILSGCDPSLAQPPDVRATMASETGVEPTDEDAWFVPEGLWLLGRPFLGAGWRTAAFVDHPMIAELRGFDRGFREFVEFGGEPDDSTRTIGVYGVGRRFVQWLNELPLDQNWFAYVHMNDLERAWYRGARAVAQRFGDEVAMDWKPRRDFAFVPPLGLTEPLFHALPPSRANRARPVSLAEYELRYDRGIRALDRSLARLLTIVEDFGRSDDITIVLAGSFGTGLGEHGLYLQAGLAEDEDLHVPLLVRPSRALAERLGWSPNGKSRAKTSDALVGLVDVAPTLVDLFDVPTPRRVHGLTLRPLLDGSAASVRERVFARSSVVPGFAIVGRDASVTVYDPARAAPAVRRSWSRSVRDPQEPGPLDAGPLDAGPMDAGPGGIDPRALWQRWEGALQHERRTLHFGVGTADRAGADDLRTLQGASAPAPSHGTPQEEAARLGEPEDSR